jgi:hypothetical protein
MEPSVNRGEGRKEERERKKKKGRGALFYPVVASG